MDDLIAEIRNTQSTIRKKKNTNEDLSKKNKIDSLDTQLNNLLEKAKENKNNCNKYEENLINKKTLNDNNINYKSENNINNISASVNNWTNKIKKDNKELKVNFEINKNTENENKYNCLSSVQIYNNLNVLNNKNYNNENKNIEKFFEDEESQFEIKTSQFENIETKCFKLDFEMLAAYTTNDSISISQIKMIEGYRVDGIIYALVKGIEIFGKDVCRWELCDMTGIIFGSSCLYDRDVEIGDIVCLENCALWKLGENHLNIVEKNIKKIYKPGFIN